MSTTSGILMIVGMAIVTYCVKASVLLLGHRIRFAPIVRTALGFVPVTVLTAIVVPIVIAPHHGDAELSWRNPQLVAALGTAIVGFTTRHALATIGFGLALFFAWQYAVA
ncbi:AzlD domain-containing protein [Pararobbsia silviterrae]|uniref:AzlD domain-containing protein n=1 Tax=Pararobbsia silviterrae TaxID=1792498 RepID=A0A494XY52_9BURK|nr:AzlD domain-containing protein [Pararobbsia silviterrae]RKP54674.1 AzlD domain-containing protein [Pararobbsia silviterrae]